MTHCTTFRPTISIFTLCTNFGTKFWPDVQIFVPLYLLLPSEQTTLKNSYSLYNFSSHYIYYYPLFKLQYKFWPFVQLFVPLYLLLPSVQTTVQNSDSLYNFSSRYTYYYPLYKLQYKILTRCTTLRPATFILALCKNYSTKFWPAVQLFDPLHLFLPSVKTTLQNSHPLYNSSSQYIYYGPL